MMTRRALPILAAGLLLSGGCLVTSKNRQVIEGTHVSDATLRQIEPGRTTEQWLIATLGAPSSCADLGDGNRILRYSYTETRSSRGSVLLLFKGRSSSTRHQSVSFEVARGVVTRYWEG